MAAATVVAMAASLAALKFAPLPYVWIGLIWAACAVVALLAVSGSVAKAIAFNAAFACVLLAGIEFYVAQSSPPKRRDFISDQSGDRIVMEERNPVLGYAPVPALRGRWQRWIGDALVFDVRFSIDESGLRNGPPATEESNTECVLFFGGSYTFGSGVEDYETAAYRTGEVSRGRYLTRNFGYRGYGPHQMLAAIEHGLVDDAAGCEPRYAVYQFHPGHIRRVAGLASWDTEGPKYVINDAGELTRHGHFGRPDPRDESLLSRLLGRSAIYRELVNYFRHRESGDARLLAAVVGESSRALERRFPGIEFHVIVWPGGGEAASDALTLMRDTNLALHPLADVLPDYAADPERYWLHRQDSHPNALAHDGIARYVDRHVLARDRANAPGR